VRAFSTIPFKAPAESDEFTIFPRQHEGNLYDVNFSLNEDGLVPVGDAFRNARLDLLKSKIPAKSQNNIFQLSYPAYFNEYSLQEAGDSISHDDFNSLRKAQIDYFESNIDLFVEDGFLGSYNKERIGVRITSDSPAVALIARNLLVRFL
jgi:hypothetical protein